MRPGDRETDGSSVPRIRREVAIMFTDMVGYSALAQRDEALSIRLLAEQRKIARAAFANHAGEEVKTIGDAFLVLFAIPSEAVACALEIQRAMAKRNARVPANERVLLRIGIHWGEILRSIHDVLGDNVNVAARIFPLAEPGGVCLSDAMHSRIADAGLETVPLGTAELKNVSHLRVWALLPEDAGATQRARMRFRFFAKQQRWRRRALLAFGVLAALIVFPFARAWWSLSTVDRIAVADVVNETGEPYLDGLTGMLTTSLEQSRRLRVVTRTRILDSLGLPATARVDEAAAEKFCRSEGVRVLLASRIRKRGDGYEMTVQGIDPVAGREWFRVSEEDLKDELPAMIDRVSSRLRLELFEQASDVSRDEVRIEHAATGNLEAYQHYFKGEQYLAAWDVGHAEAELKLATELDPGFALPWVLLSYTYWWNSDPRARPALERAVGLKERIVTRRERAMLDVLEARMRPDDEGAARLLEALLVDYPSDKGALFELADLRFHRSEFPEAMRLFEDVMRLDPGHQRAQEHLVWAYGAAGRGDDMVRESEAYLKATQSHRAWHLLVDVNLYLGRRDGTFAALKRLTTAHPDTVKGNVEARARLLLGDIQGASEALVPATDDDVFRALLLFRGRVKDTLASIDRTTQGATSHQRALRAAVQAFHGEETAAASTAREILRIGQLQDPMGLLVVEACGRAGDLACAEEAAAAQTGEALVLLARSFRARKDGDVATARKLLDEGRRKVQIRHQPCFSLEEAELELAAGDYAAAEKRARTALSGPVWTPLYPLVHPRAREVLALSLDGQGKRDEATAEWTTLRTWLAGADAKLPMADRVRAAR